MPLQAGLAASVTMTVSSADTAIALRSGSVPVLATPRLLALCEEATVKAVDGVLDETSTTVGVQVMLDHVGPSPVGRQVTAEATLEKVTGRKLHFMVSVRDERGGLVAAGRVTRVVVDQGQFLEKCR